MNKKLLICISILFVSCAALAQSFESATDAVKNMGIGWNLGNTLDANDASKTWKTTAEHETCWGQPVTKSELMTMMKEAGFGAIRVPVTWYQEMDADGKVNDAWMKRVKEVVDYVIDNGMYCILNVHHDTGADSNTFKSWLKASNNSYKANKDKYEYLWTQIAETFKDYDEHLLFEAYNEMLDEKNTWNEPFDKTDGYQAINDYATSFVTTVRATGGNNTNRNLVVNTYSASSTPDAMAHLELPEETGHIIFQLHSYPNWKSKSNAKTEIDNLISNIKSNLLDRAPVIIGEYATFTTWPSEIDYYYIDREVALYAMDYFVQKAKEAVIGTFYWMGLSDGAIRNVPAFNQPDLAETLAKAYHGDSFVGKYPTAEYTITYEQDWAELFLYGSWSSEGVKLSDYKGIRVEMDEIYGNKLQVKIYGDYIGKDANNNDQYKEQYVPLSDNSTTTTVNFDASTLGSTFCRITLQTNSGPMTAKMIKEATLIKADGTEITHLPVNPAWGCSVSAKLSPTGISATTIKTDSRNDAIYNLQGQRIQNPQKGIYIRNGKKYIAK